MSLKDFSSQSLVSSTRQLYNKRCQPYRTDWSIVCRNGSEQPVHSFVLALR